MTGYVTWQSTLGHKATGAASLTVGGHMTCYVTWQSALGHKASGTASLTVGGHNTHDWLRDVAVRPRSQSHRRRLSDRGRTCECDRASRRSAVEQGLRSLHGRTSAVAGAVR